MTPLLAWVNSTLHLLLVNIIVIAFIAAFAKRFRVGRAIVGIFVVTSLVWWGTFAVATGVNERVTVPMTWEIEPQYNTHPYLSHKHVVLRFKRNPKCRVGLYSNQVAAYLTGLSTNEVPVVFDVVKDFGRVRAFHEVQIGELTRWDGDANYAYAGERHDDPSPWP
jgi:hypothetical protein